jgi:flagellin
MTHLSMKRSDRGLSAAMQRLSTGYRINSAKDDAAGLAIANKLSFQHGGQTRAAENATHGISLVQTAEGALNEVHNMLQRMRELAVQAANDTNTAEDRNQIYREITQLTDEIHSIANRTEFNRMRILNGEADRVTEGVWHVTGGHVGGVNEPARGIATLLYISDQVKPGSFPFTVTEIGQPARLSFPTPADWTATTAGSFMLNDNPFQFEAGMNIKAVLTQAVEFAGMDIFECEEYNTTHIITRQAGRNQVVNLLGGFYEALGIEGMTFSLGTDAVITGQGGADLQVLDINDNPIPGTNLAVIANGNQITVNGTGGEEIRFNLQVQIVTDPTADPPVHLTFGDVNKTPIDEHMPLDLTFLFKEFGPMRLQIGPSHNNAIEIKIPRLNAETLGLVEYVGGRRQSLLLYTTREGANEAIRTLDKAIDTVSATRARLGAFQNRLESTVDSLDVAAENTQRSRSRIKDTDMARESTRFAQYNVMFQAAQAMLGQANQRPQQLLSLMQ